jgi:sulfur-carrier protein adenylyltransferase/sulfurtransferase
MAEPAMNFAHRIHPKLLDKAVRLLVVGCGGTGAAFASGLPYLHDTMIALGHPGGLDVTVADGDVVSATNRGRQPFNDSHIGRKKAEVLVTGLNRWWGHAWKAVPYNITPADSLHDFDIVVGCVDKRGARAVVGNLVRQHRNVRYYLDSGNGPTFGQIVLGEPHARENQLRLLTVDELLPDSVRPGPEDNGPSCSQIEALTKQAPFTNQVLADWMLFLLGQLFRQGGLDHHGMFVDLADGISNPIPIDPLQWEVIRNGPAGDARGTTEAHTPPTKRRRNRTPAAA